MSGLVQSRRAASAARTCGDKRWNCTLRMFGPAGASVRRSRWSAGACFAAARRWRPDCWPHRGSGRSAPTTSTSGPSTSPAPGNRAGVGAGPSGRRLLAERPHLHHQYHQHRLFDDHQRLCQRTGRHGRRSAGRRRMGPHYCRHGRHQHASTGTLNTARREAAHWHAELQFDHAAGLLGLSGWPRHLDLERWRHRRELALRRDRRILRGQTKDITPAGSYTNPTSRQPSIRQPALQRRHPGAVRRHLHGVHQGWPLPGRPGALGFLPEQPHRSQQRAPSSQQLDAQASRSRATLATTSRCTAAGSSSRRAASSGRESASIRSTWPGLPMRSVVPFRARYRQDRRYRQRSRPRQSQGGHELHVRRHDLATLLHRQRFP